MDSLTSQNIGELAKIPEAKLLQWYQYFQDKKFVQERENIRIALSQKLEKS